MVEKINIKQLKEEDIKKWLENIREKYYFELKKATELPRSFWETYSSFCNTSGGYIILGVEEDVMGNKIHGVANPDRILASLWDQLSNKNKVSYRNVNNEDISVVDIDGKTVIIVRVAEAPDMKKPVYIGGKFENSWIRTGDGDRKVTRDELAAFLRNAQSGQDNLPAENYTIADLDMDSVIAFKERVGKRYPRKQYMQMSPESFLIEIGGCVKDRMNGEWRYKKGTILFFGKYNAIKELFPHYHLDYFNRKGENPRWSDRVSDDEPNEYEMNIYNFYNLVKEKLDALIKEDFALDGQQMRLPGGDFDETLREGLVNCLAHADYVQGFPSPKIEAYDGWFFFGNAGKMLVSKEQFIAGGDSRPRNETVMKYFRLLGASERQGFGGPLIYKAAVANDFRRPEIYTDIEKTELKVWNIDLADSYPDLSGEEKRVLRYILKERKDQSVNNIKEGVGISDYKVRKALQNLVEEKLVGKIGRGPSTRYRIALESMEFLTQLQMAVEVMKRHMI